MPKTSPKTTLAYLTLLGLLFTLVLTANITTFLSLQTFPNLPTPLPKASGLILSNSLLAAISLVSTITLALLWNHTRLSFYHDCNLPCPPPSQISQIFNFFNFLLQLIGVPTTLNARDERAREQEATITRLKELCQRLEVTVSSQQAQAQDMGVWRERPPKYSEFGAEKGGKGKGKGLRARFERFFEFGGLRGGKGGGRSV